MNAKTAFLLILSLTCISSCNSFVKKNNTNQAAEENRSTETETTTHKSFAQKINVGDIIWRKYENSRKNEFGFSIDVSMDWPESGLPQKQLEAIQTIILKYLLGPEYKGLEPQVAVNFKVNSIAADDYLSEFIFNFVEGSYSIIEDFIIYHCHIDTSNGGSMLRPDLQRSFDLLLDAEAGEIVSLDFLIKKYNLSELSLDMHIKEDLQKRYTSDDIDFRKARYKYVTDFHLDNDDIVLVLPLDIFWEYDGSPNSLSVAQWNSQGLYVIIPWEDFKNLKEE